MAFRYIWVLGFLALLIIVWAFWRFKDRSFRLIFPDAADRVQVALLHRMDWNRKQWQSRLFLLGLAFLALAASGPQIGTRVRPVERKGVDLVIAFDTSISMDAEDVKPSRLAKAKFEIGQLILKLKGDRVAIIIFAGTSHLYLPLTTDYEAALLFLNEIDTQMIPTQGTAISAAMETAMTAFTDEDDKFKVMLLVTDGEDHEGQALELANQAVKTGLEIHTVGVGSETGSLIPIKSKDGSRSDYKRDKGGKLITSLMNPSILRDIAAAGSGQYFHFANNRDTHLDIAKAIESMEKRTISSHEYSEFEDRYQSVAFLALLCFVGSFVIPTRPNQKSKLDVE